MAGATQKAVGPKIYRVVRNLSHNHSDFVPGDTLELSEKNGAELIALGVVVDPDTKVEGSEV